MNVDFQLAERLDLEALPTNTITRLKVELIQDPLARPVRAPVLVAEQSRGRSQRSQGRSTASRRLSSDVSRLASEIETASGTQSG